LPARAPVRRRRAAPPVRTTSRWCLLRDRDGGRLGALGDQQELGPEVAHVELELVGLIARVQRRRGGAGGHRDTVADLNARGIGRGDRVAIVLPNGPEMAAAFIAVARGR
jgi:hypothetical protein